MAVSRFTLPRRAFTWLSRSPDDRIVVGVASGIARSLGVEPLLIRGAFVLLTLAGGAGVFAYALLWYVSEERNVRRREPLPISRQIPGVAALTGGALVGLRLIGLWPGDGIMLPAAIITLGVCVVWTVGDRDGSRSRALLGTEGSIFTPAVLLRAGLGAVLVFAGLLAVAAQNMTLTFRTLLEIAFPLALTVFGLVLVFGPWLYRLGQQVTEERRSRIRSQERSEMAAHLHDSVLQTLALIQRSSTEREMSTLARVQERELRSWLYGGEKRGPEGSLSSALDDAATRIERDYQVKVETVVVGDTDLDPRLSALLGACSEAMVNAARHSGAGSISAYIESGPEEVIAFVRDQGEGFNPKSIPEERGGISESIIGRMERHGGSAKIASRKGRGTEIQLRMPRR